MKIVYAIRRQRQCDFYMTDKRAAVPQGAIIYAICNAERTIENQDEDFFAAISDEEYFMLRQMVADAERQESTLNQINGNKPGRFIHKFFRALCAMFSGQSAGKRVRAEKASTYRARTSVSMQL